MWKTVNTREDLPSSTTRVLMFVRGVGQRIGTVTQLFDLPWHVCDPDWMDDRKLPLDAVASYINLDAIPWPHIEPERLAEHCAIMFLSCEPEAQKTAVRELWQENPAGMKKLVDNLVEAMKQKLAEAPCPNCNSKKILDFGSKVCPRYGCDDCGNMFTKEDLLCR